MRFVIFRWTGQSNKRCSHLVGRPGGYARVVRALPPACLIERIHLARANADVALVEAVGIAWIVGAREGGLGRRIGVVAGLLVVGRGDRHKLEPDAGCYRVPAAPRCAAVLCDVM